MKRVTSVAILFVLSVSSAAFAQDSTTGSSKSDDGIPIEQLLEGVARRTGKKFIVDPRVRAHVAMVGLKPADVDYAQLLAVLEVHGFAAVDLSGVVRVVPDASVRTMAVPVVASNKQYADSEVVTKIFTLKSAPAAMLIPMLRPLVAQNAHLASMPCLNNLVIVDRYANVQRIGALIESVDKGEPLKPRSCGQDMEEIMKK